MYDFCFVLNYIFFDKVFSRCQTFEKDRLVKFRDFLGSTEKCLDLSHRLQYVREMNHVLFLKRKVHVRLTCPLKFFSSSNFQQYAHTIENCDPDKDLIWWSDTYGAGMKMNWPTFEVFYSY